MEQLKRKAMIAWGIKLKTGAILTFSIRNTRKEAIKDLESTSISQWKNLRKEGMAVVKLEIKEIEQSTTPIQNNDSTQPFPQLKLFT